MHRLLLTVSRKHDEEKVVLISDTALADGR